MPETAGSGMDATKFPSQGQALEPTPLMLNWAAESLEELVRRKEVRQWEQPGRPELHVLTGVLAAAGPCPQRRRAFPA